METLADQSLETPKLQRLVAYGMQLLVIWGVALIVLFMQRLPSEEIAQALDRTTSWHQQWRVLDDGLRAVQLRAAALDDVGQVSASGESAVAARAAFQTLRNIRICDPSQAQGERERLDELARTLDLLGTLPTGVDDLQVSAERARARLRELDQFTQTCIDAQLQDFAALTETTRQRVLALLLAILVGVAGVIWLRRIDRAQLRSQLRFNQQLIDAIPLPLSLKSARGKFLLVNKAFEEKYEVSRSQLAGQSARMLLSPAAAQRIEKMDARALASREPINEIFDIDDPEGGRHVQVRVRALRHPDNLVTGIVAIETDVTALRTNEAQLLESNAKLNQLSLKMLEAHEDERRRIARDLHDEVGQILTALKLQLASIAKLPHLESPAAAMLTPIDLTDEALRHTRDLSASLHPHLLDDLGLEAALNWLINRFIRPSLPLVDLRCQLRPARGPQEIELVAFRVVQEALTNVVRHAGASRAGVILEARHDTLSIEVIDDGVGFDAGETWFDLLRATSVGVTSMRARVSEVGGDLHMDSNPGVGTSLRVRLPW